MPFITSKTNVKLTKENIISLKDFYGDAISFFPGKSESWLMCEIEEGKYMFFQGSEAPCAFVEIKLFGSVDKASSEKFTSAVCKKFTALGVPADRVYVRFEGGTDWGWNGSNF